MDISSVITFIGFVQGLFLIALILPKVERGAPSFYALLLLLVFVFDLGTFWLYLNGILNELPILGGIAETTLFLYGPILYFYVCSLLQLDKKVSLKANLPHFIPAVFIFVLLSPLLLGYPINDGLNRLGDMLPELFSTYQLSSLLFDHLFWWVHALIYFMICLNKLKKYRANHSSNLPTTDLHARKLHFRLIGYLMFGYLVFPIIGLSAFVYSLAIEQQHNLYPVFNAFMVFHIFGISYIGYRSQQLLTNPIKMIKYQQSGIEAQKLDGYVKKLADYFEEHQPYLKSDLNIKSVADLVDIKPNYISQAINRHYGHGFNDFINNYRVNLAKKLIIAPDKKMFTIEAIAEDVGFKSKSTFNIAFKKKMGVTPSEYRKQMNGHSSSIGG